MNLYAVVLVVVSLLNALLGVYVLYKNSKRYENIIFALMAAAVSIWTFGEGQIFAATNASDALFWTKFEWVGVSFLACLLLNFTLSFPRKRKILESKLTYLVLYLPGFIFLYFTLDGSLISGLKYTSWAEYYKTYDASIFLVYAVHFGICVSLSLYLLWKTYKSSDSVLERHQAKYIFLAVILPATIGSLTDVALPAMDIYVFPTGGILTVAMVALIAYSMTKYRVMSLMPLALENVVNGIVQGVIISDALGDILKINSSSEQILGIKQDAIGQKLVIILRSLLPNVENASEFGQFIEDTKEHPEETASSKIVLNASAKRFLDVSISPILDGKGGMMGQVALFYDLTERKKSEEELKKLNQELQSKMAELKRFNDIAVGRELRMIELKKRIAELEEKK